MPLKIIICGGGIGGLAAASYLRRQHEVTVLEKGELDLDANDYGLSIVSNAFNLLQKAGIDVGALDMVVMTRFWIRNDKNEVVHTQDFNAKTVESGGNGAPTVMARRSKVQRELLKLATSDALAGRPAQIVTGAKVESVDFDAGTVTTQDGRTFSGDLIVGADGIVSMVRKNMMVQLGLRAPPTKHGVLAFVAPIPVAALKDQPEFDYLTRTDEHAGMVYYKATGGGGENPRKRLFAYHNSPAEMQVVGYTDENEFTEEFNAKSTGIIRNVPVARVLQDFKGQYSDSLCRLFTYGQVDAWRIRDLKPLDTWTLGKAVLIGDAAHAVTPHAGQGCNITIEDAEALAYLLKEANSSDDVQTALKRFVELRKPRAEFVARRSRQLGSVQSADDESKGAITEQEFARIVYSYQGVEAALKQAAAASS